MAEFKPLDKTFSYFPDADKMAIVIKGKERLRIDGGGRFRFGEKSANDARVKIVAEDNSSNKYALRVTDSLGTTDYFAVRDDGFCGFGSGMSNNVTLTIKGKTANNSSYALSVRNSQNTSLLSVRNDGQIVARSLEISENLNYGQLGKLDVADNFTATIRAADLRLGHSSRRGNPGRALVDNNTVLFINYGGDWTGGVQYYVSLTKASSRELKTNIAELSFKSALDILNNLNAVKFNLKSGDRSKQHIGFIAEDVHELIASADRKAVNNDHIVAVLAKIVKEQQKKLSTLQIKVERMENERATEKSTRRTKS